MMATSDFFDTRTRNWRARLAISVDVMRELSRYSDPWDMYQIFARRMGQLFPTSRQITLSRRGVEKPNVRVTRFNLWNETIDLFPANWARYPVHRGGLFADLLYGNEPVVIDDLQVDSDDPAHEYLLGQQSLLAMPIFERGTALTWIVLTREEPAAFAPEQVPELVWMTNLFGRATQSLVLSQALQTANDEAAAEVLAIAELQESLLPAESPSLPHLDVAAHYRTVQRAGGDYYDFFPQPDGSLGVLIADVSGHGTPAAVLMAITHSIAHAGNAPTGDPGAFLTYLNRNLAGRYNRTSSSFVTAFYAVVKPGENSITYASAGHHPPRFFRENGTLASLESAHCLPLGISPLDRGYPERTVPFAAGDGMVMFTDGVTESLNRSGDAFGTDSLDALLLRKSESASGVLVRVLAELDRFAAGTPQADDRTVVVVRATH